jgi:hypothetical protein
MAGQLSPVSSEKSDQQLCGGGPVWVGQNSARVGYDTTNNMGAVFVAVFALPTLPEGETVTSAALAINVLAPQGVFGGELDWNIDVYGVRSSGSSKVLPTDFFDGEDDTNATKVIDNFITVKGDSPAAVGSRKSGSSDAFGAWLKTLYTGNVPNQTYAIVRLNSDIPFAGYKHKKNPDLQNASRFLKIGTGDSEKAEARPMLTITTGSK